VTRRRCPRGHFLPRNGKCHCTQKRPSSDLRGQRATLHQLYTMTTIRTAGRYL
jgi:hypothetical protein